jgi:deoxyribose-phosphate aldolase
VEAVAATREEVEGVLEHLAAGRARRPASRTAARLEEIPPHPELRKLARLMDHTLLRPEATRADVEQLCREALQFGFAVACVNLVWVSVVAQILRGSDVRVGSVAGFPLGATSPSQKRREAWTAIFAGARDIDMVMNIGAMKSGEFDRVEGDIRGVAEICHENGAVVKVILETAYLTEAEKAAACRLAENAGADFVKTSTGFGPAGATEADVRLMRQTVSPVVGVKAAGGIRTLSTALRMLEAGANRLGTSASVAILQEAASLLD